MEIVKYECNDSKNGSVVGEIEFIIVFDYLSLLHLYCCFIINELVQHIRELFNTDRLYCITHSCL